MTTSTLLGLRAIDEQGIRYDVRLRTEFGNTRSTIRKRVHWI
jgi:hypothetical protein